MRDRHANSLTVARSDVAIVAASPRAAVLGGGTRPYEDACYVGRMGLPALLSPQTWVASGTLPSVEPSALAQLGDELRKLLDEARRSRPREGSAEEEAVLKRVANFGFASIGLFGSGFIVVQRANLNLALADVVRKELATAEPERKLALRQLEQAVHTFGVLAESLAAAVADVPAGSIRALFAELSGQVEAGGLPLSELDKCMLRLQLDVMVALDQLDAPLDDLTYWAFQAITDARRVEALSPPVGPALVGELARLRSQRSWLSWDAAETAKELVPWPLPSR